MIKVYYTKVFSPLTEDAFFSYLNKVEEKRREKIRSAAHSAARLQSLTAGCLLHDVLCEETGKSSFRLAYEKNGKPYLNDYPNINFNLSHSGDYVCCAVSENPVGIDLQKITDVKEGLAERFFTQKDNQKLARCGREERKRLFFRIWSIKESYVKLTGRGLGEGLHTFEIDWEKKQVTGGSGGLTGYFEENFSLPEYCWCVCTAASESQVIWKEKKRF